MLAPPDHFGIRPFSDAMVPRNQGFRAWTRLLNKWLLHAETQPVGKDAFPVSVRLRVLPEIRYGWGTIGATHYERPRSMTAEENDDVMLFVNLGDDCVGRRSGRETTLAHGQAYIVDCSEPGSYTQPANGNIMCLRTSRNALRPLTRGLDDKLGTIIPADSESLKLLSTYLRTIGDTEPLADEGVRNLATRHVQELLALTIGAAPGVGDIARDSSVRAARLKTAKTCIRRHMTDPHLCAELVAKQLRISPRSLQRLFESEGTTFSVFVASERLRTAYGALGDPQNRNRSIAEIVLHCGFSDVSYFNRQFRARYGATPSEIRRHERVARQPFTG